MRISARAVLARFACLLVGVLTSLLLSLPGVATASQTARFQAEFTPDRLGANTTITFTLQIGATGGGVPSPLQNLSIQIPENVGFGSTTLGLTPCPSAVLAKLGPAGCPENSQMGDGSVELAAPFGATLLHEDAAISIYMGPARERHSIFEFYADGANPAIAELMFEGALLSDSAPFGFNMNTPVPSTALLPGSPAASVVGLRLNIGPRNLIYYRRVHGRKVAYHPLGISVPEACPKRQHGFLFVADLTFADASQVRASSTVACPHSGR
jgi:hypothetical protein